MYDAEHRIIKALPKLAKAATCKQLQAALNNHSRKPKGRLRNLKKCSRSLAKKPKARNATPRSDCWRKAMRLFPKIRARLPSTPRSSPPVRRSNITKSPLTAVFMPGLSCSATRKPRACSGKSSKKKKCRQDFGRTGTRKNQEAMGEGEETSSAASKSSRRRNAR